MMIDGPSFCGEWQATNPSLFKELGVVPTVRAGGALWLRRRLAAGGLEVRRQRWGPGRR